MKSLTWALAALILPGIALAARPLPGRSIPVPDTPSALHGTAGGDTLPSEPSGTAVETGSPDSAAPADTPPPLPTKFRAKPVQLGLPPALELEPGVNDPVFSILTRLVTAGIYGTLTRERLQQELARSGGKSRLPYQKVISITREPVTPGSTALIRLDFTEPIHLPIPYSILGYHPGSFTASQHCLFREWDLGSICLVETEQKGDSTRYRTINLDDVHLFGVAEGAVRIDIDYLVDLLLGDAADDTNITALMLCRWNGEWYGVAMGYGDDKGGRSGFLSLRRDKILFPPPDGLRGVGRQMRARAELLARAWDAGGGGMGAPAY